MKSSLRSLALKGFRSFVKPSTIQLPKAGLVLISGTNLDAYGVSSGSGKSSLLLAISHALGYCPFSATDLQAWSGNQDLGVELELETAEGSFLLKKGGKASLSGPNINVTGAAATQEGLKKLIGMDSELLSALTYRPQKTPGLFLSKTNSEMQEFLSILLGLDKFDAAIEHCQATLKELESRRITSLSVLSIVTANYEKAKEAEIPELWDVAQHEELYNKTILLEGEVSLAVEKATAEHKKLEDNAKQIKAAFRDRETEALHSLGKKPQAEETTEGIEKQKVARADAEKRLKSLIDKDSKRLSELNLHIAVNEKEVSLTERDAEGRKSYVKRIEELKAEILKLQQETCPRCEQSWSNPNTKEDLRRTEEELKGLVASVEEIPLLRHRVTQTLQVLEELRAQREPDRKISQMREVVQTLAIDFNNQVAELKNRNAIAVAEWENSRSQAVSSILVEERKALAANQVELDAQYRVLFALMKEHATAVEAKFQAKNKVAAVRKDNEYIVIKAREIVENRERTTQALAKAKAESSELGLKYTEESDVLEVLKAFLTAIFDEVLEEIAYNTNQMLSLVPNVAHVTLRFKSESTTQKGTVKRAITPVLTIGGAERPLKSSLSGGMSTAVELAVDLAVRKVISARSGVNPGWLILDECFEGLGATEKEACLDLLKQAARDTLILVVDHGSETKELFNERILVEYSDGQSRVVMEE